MMRNLAGRSCIRRWIELKANCPECQKRTRPSDIIVLFTSRLSVKDTSQTDELVAKVVSALCSNTIRLIKERSAGRSITNRLFGVAPRLIWHTFVRNMPDSATGSFNCVRRCRRPAPRRRSLPSNQSRRKVRACSCSWPAPTRWRCRLATVVCSAIAVRAY